MQGDDGRGGLRAAHRPLPGRAARALTWFAGRGRIGRFLGTQVLRKPGEFTMVPVDANGQPGFACYQLGDDGRRHAHALQVLAVGGAGIARIVAFIQPELFPAFGLPPVLPVRETAERS